MSVTLLNLSDFLYGTGHEVKQMVAPFFYTKLRVRQRNKGFVTAYFKTADGIRQFPVQDRGTHWTVSLDMEQGSNHTL